MRDSAPVAGAHIVYGHQGVLTDSLGRFVLRDSIAGRKTLRVRHIGFRERLDTLALAEGRGLEIVVPMTFEGSPLVECEIKSTALSYRRQKPWWKFW